jgi:hypothetical protein
MWDMSTFPCGLTLDADGDGIIHSLLRRRGHQCGFGT